jgi:hypothetical protein
MGMSKSSVTAGSTFDMEAPGVTHERILRVLGMTQRPLKSGELANALGLFSNEANGACKWLTDKGYITSAEHTGKPQAERAITSWELADKGRLWVKGRGALEGQA